MQLLLSALLGFVLGILFYSFYPLGMSGILFCVLLAGVFGVLYVVQGKKLYVLIAICMVAGALGMVRTALHPSELPGAFIPLVGESTEIEGKVIVDPDVRETAQRLTVEIREGDEVTRVLVVAPLYPEVRYGETITVSGVLKPPEPFATDGGRTFAYDKFLEKDGIFLIMERADLISVEEREGVFTHIRGALSDVKFAGIGALSVALPEPTASLASGLILGEKQGLGESLLDDFIQSGLVHIVVLSGYNVMIVAEFVLRLFGFVSKRFAASAAGITIAAFVLMAGAGPASIRAGLMAGIALYGRATGRTYDAFRALLLAGALMLLWNPLTLAYDPGFQLSFIATLGLIFGAPIVESKLSFIKQNFLRDIVASTLAAQIAVLPLLLYQNGLFSLVALPANIVVLPFVPIAMLLAAVAGIAGFLLPGIAPVIALPAYFLLSLIIWIVEVAAALPFAAFSIPAFPFAVTMLAYIALLLYTTSSRNLASTTPQLRLSRKAST